MSTAQTFTQYNNANPMYDAPRTNDDIDLIQVVRNLLVNAGISTIQCYDNSKHIMEAKSKKPEIQRFLLNQYWNLQLLSTSANSINERFSLVPNGTIESWLKLFTQVVLPFIVKHDLPKVIQ